MTATLQDRLWRNTPRRANFTPSPSTTPRRSHSLENAALTFTLALAMGLIAQATAHHLRVPGIVLFLLSGVLLGPDVLNVVRPETLGHGLETLVGMSVAVILFEGGLNLSFERLRREATVIRRLVTIGAVMTGLLAAGVAWLVMGWSWTVSLLFGSLVIVTGPTVIAPLVRRIRLTPKLATILEAEGVFTSRSSGRSTRSRTRAPPS